MAPMVAASDYPYRCLLRQHGVDLCYTQMMHAKNLVKDRTFRRTHLDLEEFVGIPSYDKLIAQQISFLGDLPLIEASPEQQLYLKGPVMAQLAGSTVESVLEAAALVMDYAPNVTGLDLNLGCPQGIARKGNYGAFLCEQDFDGVCDILSALSQYMETHHPKTMVSAKIRLPLTDEILTQERIPRLLATGISFLTIHGRTLYENKNKARACHVDRIQLAIQTAHQIQPGFPVIANGGVETYPDVVALRQETNAVAVMSSEAILETPNVFQSTYASSRQTARQRLDQQFGFAKDYLKWCQVCPPLPGVLGIHGSFHICRGHLFKFLHRYLQEQPDLRDKFSSPKWTTLRDARNLVEELESNYRHLSDEELEACGSTLAKSSWYRRHWDSMGVVHTRQVGGATAPVDTPETTMTVEEKKEELRQRIAKLKEQRLQKTAS
jgi:tRNA-dihydrouridine synthase